MADKYKSSQKHQKSDDNNTEQRGNTLAKY